MTVLPTNVLVGPARAFWRWLTSMRTALLLLFVLAVGAVPGSLLPQRNINVELVAAYLRAHPSAGAWLDRLWFFDVYASPWFSAIYLLLFTSLVGCLVPRLGRYLAALRAAPPQAPSRLDRLPHAADGIAQEGTPAAVAAGIGAAWRRKRWRVLVREHPDGTATVAAEKGRLKESGNLVLHFALLTILIGVATGSWYGWHANRLVVVDDVGFCDTLQQYDEYSLGARVTAADLPPFCVRVDEFRADYLDSGVPTRFTSQVSYTDGLDAPSRRATLAVNEPLRLSGANISLLGNGYAPILRYTDRYGVSQTTTAPFLFDDAAKTSHGVAVFPDANVDPSGVARRDPNAQVAFTGVYLPTVSTNGIVATSIHPAERNPGLWLTAYQGNIGLDVGLPQSVYSLDQGQLTSGALRQVGKSKLLKPGETWTLPDSTSVTFLGTRQWVTLAVRHDPGAGVVLAGAAALLIGLLISLTGRRRRVWARVVPAQDGRSLISLGGLDRGDQSGLTEEFAGLVEGVQGGRAVDAAAAGGDPGVRAGDAVSHH